MLSWHRMRYLLLFFSIKIFLKHFFVRQALLFLRGLIVVKRSFVLIFLTFTSPVKTVVFFVFKVFGVPLKEVTRDMRRKAKEVNFGIMYGIGPFGLATRLEISQAEAKEIIARYFERFPKVKHYIHETIETARVRGYVETMLGRRRYLPDLKSGNQNIRSNAERQAINMPIQGSAADMIKAAMIRIDKALRSKGLQTRMLLQVHDELVFELAKGEETTIRTVVTKHMQEALKLGVPLEVEIGVGNNWLEAH